jgi:hypothetical protein
MKHTIKQIYDIYLKKNIATKDFPNDLDFKNFQASRYPCRNKKPIQT